MTDTRITIQLSGPPADNGDVRLETFIGQLEAVRAALRETDRLVSQDTQASVYFRVADLRHSSPATIALQILPRRTVSAGNAPAVVGMFMAGWLSIAAGIAPPEFDSPALQAYRAMLEWLRKKRITGLKIGSSEAEVVVSPAFADTIDNLLHATRHEVGSVTGMLQQINLHRGRPVFTVYPTIRPEGVPCIFPESLRPEVVAAVDKYVEVFGQLRYRGRDRTPYELWVTRIAVFPAEDSLPTLSSLFGIAPDATDGQKSEDFIRDLRNEW